MPYEAFTERFWPWRKAVQWIVDIDGCSWEAAYSKLEKALVHGDVYAVDGYKNQIPRYLFPARLRALLVEGLPAPDREVWITRDDLLKLWPPKSPVPATAADETRAIALLRERLEADKDMTRERAFEICHEHFPTVSERGFRSRVWPEARKAAGLDPKARSGRKRTAKSQSS